MATTYNTVPATAMILATVIQTDMVTATESRYKHYGDDSYHADGYSY